MITPESQKEIQYDLEAAMIKREISDLYKRLDMAIEEKEKMARIAKDRLEKITQEMDGAFIPKSCRRLYDDLVEIAQGDPHDERFFHNFLETVKVILHAVECIKKEENAEIKLSYGHSFTKLLYKPHIDLWLILEAVKYTEEKVIYDWLPIKGGLRQLQGKI